MTSSRLQNCTLLCLSLWGAASCGRDDRPIYVADRTGGEMPAPSPSPSDPVEPEDPGETCTPACADRACGQDACGNDCGTCEAGRLCTGVGTCVEPFVPPVPRTGALSVVGGKIVGQDGEPVQLRGVSTQWLNWETTYSGSEEALRFMRDEWGLQVYRIANGVENQNGYATESVRAKRLEFVKGIIEMAIGLDVYVIVDWHTHELEHLELAKEFFAEIAETYGKYPHVIYEPLNEPIGPFGAGAQAFWSDELKPYHEAVIAAIRQHDPDNLIILGTPRWSQNANVAAADPIALDGLAYTLHFYSCTHTSDLRNEVQPAVDAGLPLFVTEWGSTHADGGTSSNPGVCLDEADAWHDWLDEHSIGSVAWKLTTDGDSSALLLSGASVEGGWTNERLSEHGQYVRNLLQTR